MQTTILTARKNGTLYPDDISFEFKNEFGRPIRYYDDGMGPLWIFRDTMGIVGIVRAQSWVDAYSIVEDEFLPVVPVDKVYEAYGFDNEFAFHAAIKIAEETKNYPDLLEGYSFQSNSTGTGIVEHDLNGEDLSPLTLELCERLKIQVFVKLGE